MSDFVLDASVVAALYLPALPEQRQYGIDVLSLMREGAVPAVPGLFALELGSVLVRARRKRLVTATALQNALADLDALFLEIHHIPYTVADVVGLAQRYTLAGYDAVYFDLARRLGVPLASIDRGHQAACRAGCTASSRCASRAAIRAL